MDYDNIDENEKTKKIHHLKFDEEMQNQAVKRAEAIEAKASLTTNPLQRKKLIETADSYHEAISEISGLTKAEAVEWIQENAGGHKSAEMEDAGEYEGDVWSRQTACDVLSSWQTIFTSVASIISKNNKQEE